MQLTDELRRCDESSVRPCWRGIARKVGEDLPPRLVEPQHSGGALESDVLEVPKEGVDRRRPRANRAPDGVSYPHDTPRYPPTTHHDLIAGGDTVIKRSAVHGLSFTPKGAGTKSALA